MIQDTSLGPSFVIWFNMFWRYREHSQAVSWEFMFIYSRATSPVDAYERHLKFLRQRHLHSPSTSPIQILKHYLLAVYRCQQTSSDMR